MFLQRYNPKSHILSEGDRTDISLLPPCQATLKEHIKRANDQALIWNTVDQVHPDLPPPDGHGWSIASGEIDYNWCTGKFLPQELVDILISEDGESENEETAEDEIDVEFENVIDILYEDEAEDYVGST